LFTFFFNSQMDYVLNLSIFTVNDKMTFFRQVEDASEIASIAQQAYNISSEAYEMARQALEQQHYTANQIRVLEVQVETN
jgi:hypothetical protein